MTKKILYFLGWTLLISVNLYFVFNFPLQHFNYEAWTEPFGPLLTIHIFFGMITILIAPFQFFSSIRKSHPHIRLVYIELSVANAIKKETAS